MPENIPVYNETPLACPGLYLGLFHGRPDPDAEVDGWGTDGPVIGPLAFAHTTYRDNTLVLRFVDEAAALPYLDLRLGTHSIRDQITDDATVSCDSAYPGDLFFCDGIYYGDWTLFLHVPGHATNPPKRCAVDELLSCNLLGRLQVIREAVLNGGTTRAEDELKDLIENFVRPMQSDHNL